MKKIIIVLFGLMIISQTVFGMEKIKIKNDNGSSFMYEDKGDLFSEPQILTQGKRWNIVEKDSKIFAELEVGKEKEKEFIELPLTDIEGKKYIDFSFFAYQAGLDYVYNPKKKEIVIEKSKEQRERPDRKVVYMWDPDLSYREGQPYFTEKTGDKIISPAWGSYKEIDKSKIPLSYMKEARRDNMAIEPLLHNDFDVNETKKLMRNKKEIRRISNKMTALAVVYGFNGWNLDFENMDNADKDLYSDFVREIADSLHQENKKISVDITVYNEKSPYWSLCYDRKALSEFVDYEIIMGYDQTPGGSLYPGSTSSYDWLDANVEKILTMVPKEKLVLGLPLYTRVWRGRDGMAKSAVLTLKNTDMFIKRHRVKAKWDEKKKQYTANWIEQKTLHRVWFEEYRSLGEKMKLINKYDLKGVAFWRYGFEESDLYGRLEGVTKGKDFFKEEGKDFEEKLIAKFRNRIRKIKGDS